jgi:hypothetical protein
MLDRNKIATSKLKARSAISNGSTLLSGIDGRSRDARRYRDLYRSYLEQAGTKHADLCRQLATLILQRERIDAALVRGEDVDAFHLVRLSGAINRTLSKLNLGTENEAVRRRREREDREAGLIA